MQHRQSRRVGVLMGGWGEERDISIKTGEAVAAALEGQGHDVVRVFAGPGLDQTLRHAKIDVAFIALHGRMGEDGRVQGLLVGEGASQAKPASQARPKLLDEFGTNVEKSGPRPPTQPLVAASHEKVDICQIERNRSQ